MNAADDTEVACYAAGESLGDFCAKIFSSMIAALPPEERDALDDQETFRERMDAIFTRAVGERFTGLPDPQAAVDGWRDGFKRRIEREWPDG